MSHEQDVVAFQTNYLAEISVSGKTEEGRRDRTASQSWNDIGIRLIHSDPADAEKLYSWELDRAADEDARSGGRLKKGIEYCNLGAAQFMQGKVREAYRSFELAEEEDHAWGQASHAGLDVLESYLLLPAGESLRVLVEEFARSVGLPESTVESAKQFWVNIRREDRLSLREVLPDLLQAGGDTVSGRNSRLTTIGKITRVTESVLRMKYAAPLPAANEPALLNAEFGQGPANYLFQSYARTHGRVGPANLDGHLVDALAATVDPLTRAMIVFYVARNYAAHYTDSSARCLTDDSQFRTIMQNLAFFATGISVSAPAFPIPSFETLESVVPGNVTSEYATPVWAVTSPSVLPSSGSAGVVTLIQDDDIVDFTEGA